MVLNQTANSTRDTIQAAIDAASAGDTIVVGPGIYDAIVIDRSLTLDASGPGAVVINGPGVSQGSAIRIEDGVTGVTINGFEVNASAGDLAAIHAVANNANITLTNNTVNGGAFGYAFLAGFGTTGLSDSTITGNTFSGSAVLPVFNINRPDGIGGSTVSGNTIEANTIEDRTDRGDATLSGIGGTTELVGGFGANRLIGGSDGDTLIGGRGDDVYVVSSLANVVVEAVEGGFDTVETALDGYVLPDNVEALVVTSATGISVSGNTLDNVLTGGRGNDTLDGGGGANFLRGGLGDDVYIVRDVRDRVIEKPGEGYDRVLSSVSYILPDHVEELILTGTGNLSAGVGHGDGGRLIGNPGDNRLTGGAGNDWLDGVAGSNLLEGGAGDDVLVAGSGSDRMSGGTGNNSFAYVAGRKGSFTVLDFQLGSNKIGFADMGPGFGFDDLTIVSGRRDTTVTFKDEGEDVTITLSRFRGRLTADDFDFAFSRFNVNIDRFVVDGELLESLTPGSDGIVLLGLEAGIAPTGAQRPAFDLSLDSYAVLDAAEGLTAAQLGDAGAVAAFVGARLDTDGTVDNGERNATVIVVTAADDPTKAAVWAHGQTETGDSTVDAAELTRLAELNLFGGAFTAENLLPQPQAAPDGTVIDVATDVVALRAPLAARTLVDLETTTPAAPYVGPYRSYAGLEVSLDPLELTIDFGFSGAEWEPVTLVDTDLFVRISFGGGVSSSRTPLQNFSTRTVFETADAFYARFRADHVTGYRLENGKFIVSLEPAQYVGAQELSVPPDSLLQVIDGALLPSINLARDEYALVSSSESTLDTAELDDASAVASLLNALYTFAVSGSDAPRSTIFAITARDNPDQVAFWEHRQAQAGDASVTAEALSALGRFTTVNGVLQPGNLAPTIPVPYATVLERSSFPGEDWVLVDRTLGGRIKLDNDDDLDRRYASMVAVDVLLDIGVSVEISNEGDHDFLAALRTVRIEMAGSVDDTAQFDISASPGPDGVGVGDNFLRALESITVINSGEGDVSVSISVSGGDNFMPSLRSIHLETRSSENRSADLSISASANDGLTNHDFMPVLETITVLTVGGSASLSISNSGGNYFMQSLRSITAETQTGGIDLSISASANYVERGGRGENFMAALETITLRGHGPGSSISLSISHSGGAAFMQSLQSIVLEAVGDVEFSLSVSHNFDGANNERFMRSLETIVMRAGVEGKASLSISVEHADHFMESLKSILVESAAQNYSAELKVQNKLDGSAIEYYRATQKGDDFMTALETITVRGQRQDVFPGAIVLLENEAGDRFMDALHTIVAENPAGSTRVVLQNGHGDDFLGALETIQTTPGGGELRFQNLTGDRYATALDGVTLGGGGVLELTMSNQSGAEFMTSFSLIDLSGREDGSSSVVNTGGALDHALEIRVGGGDLTYDNGAMFDAVAKSYTDLGNDAQESFIFVADETDALTFGDVVIRGFDAVSAGDGVTDRLVFRAPGIALDDLVFAVDPEAAGRADLRITSGRFDGAIVLEGNFTGFSAFGEIAETLWV